MDNAPDLIIFGGSFDPVHLGHVQMVEATLGTFPLANVMVVPAFVPLVSQSLEKQVSASFSDRMGMTKLAFASLKRVEVSPLEQELPRPSFTVNTILYLRRLMPNRQLGLLMGGDQLLNFPTWHQPLEILKNAMLVVFPRAFETQGEIVTKGLDMLHGLGLSLLSSDCSKIVQESRSLLYAMATAPKNVSSTLVRRSLKAGGRLEIQGCLPDEVSTYIAHHGLYQS